jgi:hypothetical protein
MPIFECARCNDMTYSASVGAVHPCAQCGSDRVRVVAGDFGDARASGRDLGPADHASLVYDQPESVAAFCARYLTEGVESGEHVVAAVPASLREPVKDLLTGETDAAVDWSEPLEVYGGFAADPAASTYEQMISEEPRHSRILAGPDTACADGIDADEFDRYERLAHEIITEQRATVVCVFDAAALPPELLRVAERRHSLTVVGDAPRRNEQFEYQPV